MTSLRDQIAGIDDSASEIVEVPEWKVKVKVKSMILARRNAIAKASRDKKGNLDTSVYYPRLVVETCYDPDTDEKLFEMRDIPMLEGKNAAAVDRLAKAALKLSGVQDEADGDSEEAEEAAQRELDEAGKDFSSTATSEHDS